MNHREFEKLIYPYLDGELDAAQRREVELHLESSEDARAIIDYERRLAEHTRAALTEDADMVAKGRLLANFRAAAEEAQTPDPVSIRFAWRAAAAAVLLFALAWLGSLYTGNTGTGGVTPADIPNEFPASSRNLIDVVRVSENSFRADLSEVSEKVECRYRCVDRCLQKSGTAHEFWAPNSDTSVAQRYAACAKMVSSCLERAVELRCLPESFQLIGARKTTLTFEDQTFSVPHLVLMSDDERLSVYVICGSQSQAIAKGLHEIDSTKSKKNCLLGCPQRGVMVKKCGNLWYVMISRMNYDKLKSVAEEI